MAAQIGRAPPDPTVLKPGIATSVTGLRQAFVALQSATLEVRRFMLDEASIIYECKTCNNMFRSLGNLIAHKRSFCCHRYAEVNHVYRDKMGMNFSESETVFIENEKLETVMPQEAFDLKDYRPSFDLLKEAAIIKEIKSEPVVSRLLPPKKQGLKSIVDRLNSRIEQSEKTNFLVLEPMVESNSAVFQTLGEFQTIGKEVREMKADTSETVVIAPSGAILPKGPLPSYESPTSPCNSDNSKENNEVDMKMKFVCPLCKTVNLAKMSNMYRHLEKKHGKSHEEARALRKKIKASAKPFPTSKFNESPKSTNKNQETKKLKAESPSDSKQTQKVEAKRIKPNSQALNLAKALGLVDDNGVGTQKTAEKTTQDLKRARKERRLARSGEDGAVNSAGEDEDDEVSFNVGRLGPEPKKTKLSNSGYLAGDFMCELCDKAFKTPTFLNQHYASSHFRLRLMDDYAADIKKKKCSLCLAGFDNASRLIIHVGATHKICQEYLKSKPSLPKPAVANPVLNKPKSEPAPKPEVTIKGETRLAAEVNENAQNAKVKSAKTRGDPRQSESPLLLEDEIMK